MCTYSKPKAIFFDIDGTLSYSFELGYKSTKTVLENNGFKPCSVDEFHFGTRYTTPCRFAWHATGDPDHAIGIELGKQFDDMYVQLVSVDSTPLYEGIESLTRSIATKCKLGALTNACGAYGRAVIQAHKLDDIFLQTLGADDVPNPKPFPEGLYALSAAFGLSPRDCVYVGDSPTDGQAATAAGMRSIGVSYGSNKRDVLEYNFTYVVDTVQELSNVVNQLI